MRFANAVARVFRPGDFFVAFENSRPGASAVPHTVENGTSRLPATKLTV